MANVVENILVVEGEEEQLNEFLDKFKGEDNHKCFAPFFEQVKNSDAWRIKNYSTKTELLYSDISNAEIESNWADFVFETAWTAPILWVQQVAKKHDLDILLKWMCVQDGEAGFVQFTDGDIVTETYSAEGTRFHPFAYENFGLEIEE